MNFKENQLKKEFTGDHRRNYTIYNTSNIFNTDVVVKDNEKVQQFKNKKQEIEFTPKYSNQNDSAFSRKLNEYYTNSTLEKTKSYNSGINNTLGFLKSQMDEAPINKSAQISAKEKKLLELNPKLNLDDLKYSEQTNSTDSVVNKNNKNFDFSNTNSSKVNRVKLNQSNIFNNEQKAVQIENYNTNPNGFTLTEENEKSNKNGEYNIINNGFKPIVLKNEENNRKKPKNSYLEDLMKNKNDPKIKKRLNLVSQMDEFKTVEYKPSLTEGNDENFIAQQKTSIKSSIANKLNTTNNNKIRSIMDQTSTLFGTEFYEKNLAIKEKDRATYKFQLIPKDSEPNAKLLSNEEIKLIFAKKGIHAFDIARHEFCEDISQKENIKISIRKTEKNTENLMKVIKDEAKQFGFEIGEIKERDTNKKATDIIPYDSHWDKIHLSNKLKKRLKIHENDPEPPKAKLERDEIFKNQIQQVNTGYKNKYLEEKKKNAK